MCGSFVQLTESETSRLMLVNADRMICVAPHGRGGSFIYVVGGPDKFEVEETPARVAEILQAAGVAAAPGEPPE
ncbi:MAG TPA: hypothetical protein VHL51_07720 [Gaiellales bacterium]|jgi:hypothetical protein|nr:hypothetical protein [Gaiellales bacterium]